MKPFDTAYPDGIFLGRIVDAARSVEPTSLPGERAQPDPVVADARVMDIGWPPPWAR
jgi:hypothetical protein